MPEGLGLGRAMIVSLAALWFGFSSGPSLAADPRAPRFSVATFNVENYLAEAVRGRPAKTEAGRRKVRESLLALRADVVALQEMGGRDVFLDLHGDLAAGGLDYPYWEHISGYDTNLHLAILSRYPIVRRRRHTDLSYLLNGRRLHVGRGFSEVEIEVHPEYRFTLLSAHLKSKRPVSVADQAEMREQEALALRRIVDSLMETRNDLNLVVAGDLNDFQDSVPVKALIGRGRSALVDTRPAEPNGDSASHPSGTRYPPRRVTWTHHYGKEDTFSRIDYILVNRGMEREWRKEHTFILTLPDWGQASDHRPIVAGFEALDR